MDLGAGRAPKRRQIDRGAEVWGCHVSSLLARSSRPRLSHLQPLQTRSLLQLSLYSRPTVLVLFLPAAAAVAMTRTRESGDNTSVQNDRGVTRKKTQFYRRAFFLHY